MSCFSHANPTRCVSKHFPGLQTFGQIGSVEIPASPEDLYPAVGMHSLGEEVVLDLNAEWRMEEDDGQMIVDSHEEDWSRLHDVKVTGTVSHSELSVLREMCKTFFA